MHDDAGPDLQSIANMACGRISGKVPWAPTCIDRSGSVAGRETRYHPLPRMRPASPSGCRAPSTVGHSTMSSSRPKAPTAVPRFWNYGPSAPSTFTGGSHATRRACKAPYDSRPRPPCSCRDHGSAKQGRGTVTPVGFEGHRDHSPSEGSQDRGIAPNGAAWAVIGGLRGHTRRMRRFGFDWRALRRFGAVG